MLFHIQATHTADNCPALSSEQTRAALQDFAQKMPDLAQELGLKIHFWLSGAPEHVFFGLLEGDSITAIQRLAYAAPFKQDFRVTPVQSMADVVAGLGQHA